MLDWLRAPYPWLVLDGTEYFVNGEPQWVKCCSALKARSGSGERIENACLLKAGFPQFWLPTWVGVPRCEFIFSPSLLRLRE